MAIAISYTIAMSAHYCFNQMGLLVMFHAIFLFWAVKFPFSFRQLRVSGRLRYAHLICVLLALIVPLPGPMLFLRSGFFNPRNPPLVCFGESIAIGYSTFIFPISLYLGTTSCLMMFIFWKIFKEFALKDIVAGKILSKPGRTEIKIMIVIIYYTIMGLIVLVTLVLYFVRARWKVEELIECESTGTRNCVVNLRDYHSLNTLLTVSIVMFSLTPVVTILFSFNRKACKRQ